MATTINWLEITLDLATQATFKPDVSFETIATLLKPMLDGETLSPPTEVPAGRFTHVIYYGPFNYLVYANEAGAQRHLPILITHVSEIWKAFLKAKVFTWTVTDGNVG